MVFMMTMESLKVDVLIVVALLCGLSRASELVGWLDSVEELISYNAQ
jgi:hypothetical protein